MFGLFSSPRYTDPQLGEFQRSRGYWRGLISFQGDDSIPLVVSSNRKAPDIQALQALQSAHVRDMDDDLIKLQLAPTANPAVFYAILYAARLVNMPVAGHLPYTASLLDPRAKQLVSIEHDKAFLLAMACQFLWRMVKP